MEVPGRQSGITTAAQLPVLLLPQASFRLQAPVQPQQRCSFGGSPHRTVGDKVRPYLRAGNTVPCASTNTRPRNGMAVLSAATCAFTGRWHQAEDIPICDMVAAVLLISCLNLIGATAVAPVTPALLRHFALYSDACLGLMSSCFAVGRLATTSLWPIASDYIGRRRCLCIAMVGGAVSALLQGVAISLNWSFSAFLLLRGVAGTFSGVAPVVKAAIVDAFPRDEVPKVLAYREAASTFAFVVGPVIGGFLASSHYSMPLYFAGLSGLVAALIAKRLPGEQPAQRRPAGAKRKQALPQAQEPAEPAVGGLAAWLAKGTAPLLLLSLVWSSVRSCFHAYYPLILARRYTMDAMCVGTFMTAVSLPMVFVQIAVFDPVRRRCGLERTLAIGSVLIALGLWGIGVAPAGVPFALFSGFYAVGVGLLTPALPALLLQTVPSSRCGTLLGVESALVNLGRVVAPPIYGLLPLDGASQVSGVVTLAASFLAYRCIRKHRVEQVEDAKV